MKTVRVSLALLLGLLLLQAAPVLAASTLTTIGEHPFCRPPLQSEGEMRQLAVRERVELQKGFAKAGHADLYPEFERQVQNAEVREVQVQQGETMQWMVFRRKGTGPVVVARDVTWGGKEPFAAYELNVDKDGKRYVFLVPKGCGNFALRRVEDVPPAPAPPVQEPKPVVNQAPSCNLKLSATEVRCGETITAVATPQDMDGRVVSVTFMLKDPTGKVVWQKTDDQAPFEQKITIPCDAKSYRVTAVAVDDKGAVSTTGCDQQIMAKSFPGGPVVDLGYAHIFDPADYAFGRIGYELPLVDELYLMGMIGGFWKVSGCTGDSAFVADLTLNYHWLGPLSFGAGVGYWSGDDGKLDVIANVGLLVYGERDGFNATVFLEGRSGVDEFDALTDKGRYGIGLRFRF